MKKITVIIPCYNEAAAIADVIKKFPRTKIKAHGYNLDILVVDNNSSDGTADIARAAGARVIHEAKPGKGNALRAGFYNLEPDTDYVAMLDGDDTYKADELLRLIEPLDSGFAKVIIGSRMHGKMREGAMKKFNHFGNRMYSWLVRSIYHIPVTDVLTGYYAWSRDTIEELRQYLTAEDFRIEMEMITKMARLGYVVYCVPISYDPRLGDSSLKPIQDGARILKACIQNRFWQPDQVAQSDSTTAQPTLDDPEVQDKELSHERQAAENSVRI